VSKAELSKALDHIRARVAGEISLEKTLAEFDPRSKNRSLSVREQEADLPLNVKLATGLFEAGRITEAEFVFHCGFHIVSLHEKYHFDGLYDSELEKFSAKMHRIEKRHGLKDNEYWLITDAPADYLHESQKYDAVLKRQQIEVFRKFAPPSLADKLENDADLFWNLYERGRRSVFEKEDHLASVLDLITLYESEAQKSADAEAYYASITMLGSAAEARILLECLRQRTKVKTIVRKLPKKEQPRSNNPLEWTLANLVSVASVAGWLPNIDDGDVIHVVSGWANRLRTTRNLLHPGRHAVEKPHTMLGRKEWLDAFSAHTALRHAIESARKGKRTKAKTKAGT
jgi:hypothetical protein